MVQTKEYFQDLLVKGYKPTQQDYVDLTDTMFSEGEIKLAKFTIGFADFQPNGTQSGTITIGTLPAKAVVSSIKTSTSTSFNDIAVDLTQSTFTLLTNSATYLGHNVLATTDSLKAPYTTQIGCNASTYPNASEIDPISLKLQIVIDDDGAGIITIDDLTQGSMTIWVWYTIGQ